MPDLLSSTLETGHYRPVLVSSPHFSWSRGLYWHMEDGRELSSGQAYDQDVWGHRSDIISEKAQELLGVRCTQFDGISIGEWW